MRILMLGAGLMAHGALHHYLGCDDVESVVVTDRMQSALDALRERVSQVQPGALASGRVSFLPLDASDIAAVRAAMSAVDGVFCAVHYGFNEAFTRAAIEAGANMVDLGGNNDVVRAQLALDADAVAAGVSIIPDCGLAPGFASMLVAWGLARLAWADTVRIRVGGLPLQPREPLRYERLFSVEGLINEYVEPPLLVRNGELVAGQPLGDVETVAFDQPVGTLEAFNTSGGVSTLPDSFRGRLRNLDYKTLRYPGHAHAMRWLYELGLMSSDAIDVGGGRVVPRELLAGRIAEAVPLCERDRTVVRVEFEGAGNLHRLEVVDEFDASTQLTAMMRTTAFPAAIVSTMQCRGQAARAGVTPQEAVLDPDAYMREIAAAGIVVHGLPVGERI